jgi:hypothetical protein
VWAAEPTYETLGTRLRLQIEDARYAAVITVPLAMFERSRAATRARDTYQVAWDPDNDATALYHDGSVLATGGPAGLTNRWVQEANQRFVLAATTFAAHAGVVGSDRGVAALVAESGAGKTTLTGASVLAGLRYGSDEALCVSADGTVVPYPKPLGMSSWTRSALEIGCPAGFEELEEAPIVPETLGAAILEPGRRLTHVIIPEVEPGSAPELSPMSPSEVMGALISNSFNHYRDPAGTFALTADLARSTVGYRLRYSEPAEAAAALRQLLA